MNRKLDVIAKKKCVDLITRSGLLGKFRSGKKKTFSRQTRFNGVLKVSTPVQIEFRTGVIRVLNRGNRRVL